jgi:alkylhydroperoxidase family enzyme
MNQHLAELARRLRDTVLHRSGVTETSQRQAIEARASSLDSSPDDHIPTALYSYVDKVARHAHKVTDKDIEALKQAGYTEDAIFEITISAAVGAAYARLERGLEILKGAK